MNVLVINAGSSSLKYQLMDTDNAVVLAKGLCERIGIDGRIEHKPSDGRKIKKDLPMPDHAAALKIVVDTLIDPEIGCIKSMDEIGAVGHRVVHGGEYFNESVVVTPEVVEKIELCKELAPLHNGPAVIGIRSCAQVMENIPQVVVFDTAFHQTMPDYAYFYAIPYEYYNKYKIRRYGFHGTSHRYVSAQMTDILGKVEGTRIITCHLGNGSSITAVKDGKSIDTTMGFTPLDGLEMGTRSGSIDPAIVTYLMEKENLTPKQMNEILNKKSGLLGISEVSSDSRDIEDAIAKGNQHAILADRIMSYQIKKYIGWYAAAMGGVDAVVFTAGLGENNVALRANVCQGLEFLGIELDDERNKSAFRQSNNVEISKEGSKVKVYVIPTNEELVIAMDTAKLVENAK
ncbi:MAG: acetate kinase [Clostridia bacterium]|nr:acetate kinase [Clostridia bacterium]